MSQYSQLSRQLLMSTPYEQISFQKLIIKEKNFQCLNTILQLLLTINIFTLMSHLTIYQNVDSVEPGQQETSLTTKTVYSQRYPQQQVKFQKILKWMKYIKIFLIVACALLLIMIYIQFSKELPVPTNIRRKLPQAFRIFDQNLFYIETTSGKNKQNQLKQATNVTGLTLVYVTQDNMQKFSLEKYPFSKMYEHLSPRHKQQYLKAFFNHFYGGGYVQSEVPAKKLLKNWQKGRTKFRKSSIWIIGDRVEQQSEVPHFQDAQLDKKIHDQGGWKKLLKYNYFIIKPSNKLTQQIYKTFQKMIKQNTHALENKKYPFDQDAFKKVFYATCYRYIDRLTGGLQPQDKLENSKGQNL